MIRHQQKATSAFTLIEAIVTLFLISLICLFQFVPSDYSKDKMSEEQFWQNFRQNWNNLSIKTREKKKPGLVIFWDDSVEFVCGNDQQGKKTIPLPSSLHKNGGKKEERLYVDGGTQPQKISLFSDLDEHTYDIFFELGFGRQYRVQEKTN